MTRLASTFVLLTALAACGGDDGGAADAAPPDAPPPGGTFALTWTLADLADNPITCDDVAGTTLSIAGAPSTGVVGFSESFTCGTGAGTSSPVPPGTYNLTIDLRTTAASLLTNPIVLSGVVITANQETSGLAAAFAIDPVGTLAFALDAQGDGTNCGTVETGGGAINGMTIELEDKAGACVDGAELVVSAGGGAEGTYVTDCATPLVFGCIETDQTVTMLADPSGPYSMTITADKGGIPGCYQRLSSFKVPGHGLTLDLGDLALSLGATEECDPSLIPDAGL